jgi:hypothetical protein
MDAAAVAVVALRVANRDRGAERRVRRPRLDVVLGPGEAHRRGQRGGLRASRPT